MSPKLPLNRCVARIVNPNTDNLKSKLFWRGDVEMMRYESQDDIYINCQNADVSSTGALKEMLRDAYMMGRLQRELSQDESQCKWNSDVVVRRSNLLIGEFYSSRYRNWRTRLHGHSLDIIHIRVKTGEEKKVRHLQLARQSVLIRYS